MNRFIRLFALLSLTWSLGCSGDPQPSSTSTQSEAPSNSTESDSQDTSIEPEEDDATGEPESGTSVDSTTDEEPEAGDENQEEDINPRRSLGCDLAVYDASSEERFLDVNGVSRRFQIKLPTSYDPSRAYPVLFALHGLNETGNNVRSQFENVIDDDALQVFPDGEGEQWNNSTDMEFIDTLLTKLEADYCIDPAQVFAAGFSAGGGGTHAIGCYLGDRFRAIAPIAGTGTFTECEGRVAVIQIQGTADIVAREEAAAAVRAHWLAVNQCEDVESVRPSDYSECEEFVGCMEDYPTLYCEHSRGHEWPQWANPVIWDFFMGLDPIVPGDDPEEGNDGAQASSVKFTIDIPEDFEGVPLKIAPILYGPNIFQPIFVAPSLILNNGMEIGDEFVLGEEVEYEISPINLAGLELPADYTFTVVVYVEGGGDPTPCGKDWIGLAPVTIEDTGNLVVEETMRLEPFWAIPFFFDCPEE